MSSAAEAEAEARELAHAPRSERVERLFGVDLFDYQAAIANDDSSDVVTTCGRQVGKTETGGAIGADAFICSDGHDVMIAAKWQETADEMFRRAKGHLATAGFGESHPEIVTWNKTEVESITGARLYSKTLKTAEGDAGDNQRGKLPRVVIVDESAIVDGTAFTQVIEPMFATHGDNHEFYLFSTPRGRQGYHFEKHENDPAWSSHHIGTPESPLVDSEWIEAKKADVDRLTWRQEYLGEFIDLGEVYIPRATYDATAAVQPSGAIAYLGVDVARRGKDRTVYVPQTADGVVVESAIRSEDVSDIPGIVDTIGAYHERHDLDAVGIDENAVGGGVVDYAAQGLGSVIHAVPFTTKRKGQMYRKLKADLEAATVTVPDADHPDASEHAVRLRDEAVNLQFDYTANGNLKIGHAPGGRDDYPDALAVANWVRENANVKTTRRRGYSGPTKGSMT